MCTKNIASPDWLDDPAGPVIASRTEIRRQVVILSAEIARTCGDGELTVVGVLTGAVIFLADLVRTLTMPLRLETVTVESYPGRATESQGARLLTPMPTDLRARDVLIVNDILDTGRTLGMLLAAAATQKPASLRSCVLLRKPRPDIPDRREADFVGFDIPDVFVVGYGLDFDGLLRNLPDVHALKPFAEGA